VTPWGDGLPGLDDVPIGGWGDGLPLGPSTVGPQVVSAVAVDSTTTRLTYNKEVQHSNPGNINDSLNPANYAFSGGLSAVSVSVNQANPTVVDIIVTPAMENINYTVVVSNVEDLAGNLVDPLYNSATYLGPENDEANDFIAEILIGDEVVWSANSFVNQQKIKIDVARFYGKFPLTFRIRGIRI